MTLMTFQMMAIQIMAHQRNWTSKTKINFY
jgi:hypothetical protein